LDDALVAATGSLSAGETAQMTDGHPAVADDMVTPLGQKRD
jgi:hypothetical protein